MCGGLFRDSDGTEIRMVPWRKLTSLDLELKSTKARLRDLRALFSQIEDNYRETVIDVDFDTMISIEDAQKIWDTSKIAIELPQTTNKGRKRHRADQLKWSHHLQLLRSCRRRVE